MRPRETAPLRGQQNLLAIEAAAADHDAVIERTREIELGKMRLMARCSGPRNSMKLSGRAPGDALAAEARTNLP